MCSGILKLIYILQKKHKKYRIQKILMNNKEGRKMNFNDKKTKRMIAIVTMVVIVAMIATSIIPYLIG